MRVVVVGPNLPQQAKATFHVHAEGCVDMCKGWIAPYARQDKQYPYEFSSRRELVDSIYCDIIAERDEDEDNSDLDEEFHYAPCVDGLPESD